MNNVLEATTRFRVLTIQFFEPGTSLTGSSRVFVRKGKLTLDRSTLTPIADGMFRLSEPWSPERVSFGLVVNGHATRMKLSGVDHYRTSAP